MTVYTLKRRQHIKRPLDEVFAFFSRPENLELLTPRHLRFQMLTPSPIQMKEGALIDYAIRLLGISFRWTTYITLFNPLRSFVDVQLRGPYTFWHHTHTFDATVDGTIVTDEVTYALPFSFLGRMAHGLFVKYQLRRIFNYREAQIADIFSSDTGPNHFAHTIPEWSKKPIQSPFPQLTSDRSPQKRTLETERTI